MRRNHKGRPNALALPGRNLAGAWEIAEGHTWPFADGAPIARNRESDELKYGDGQRDQFGEGTFYRPEDKTKGAQESTEHDFACGKRTDKSLPDPRKQVDECR